jgi:hypothetical protein
MEIANRKEQFSLAFIHAVASVAGFGTTILRVDDDSVDIGIRGNRRVGSRRRAPQLDVQAKCTETDDGGGACLSYALKMKNYDDLRDHEVHVPRILVVLCVPREREAWLRETSEETAMRRCAFWASLRGLPAEGNETSRTVQIPRKQLFTVRALTSMMHRIGEGGNP